LDPQAVVGVGDGENDLPFLSAVGLKLVMGNAVPELKPLADHVIPSLQEEGVRWAVEQFFGESNQ
jgi:peptidyl-prolyl cis-trans isomerase B (cyclophilin B)